MFGSFGHISNFGRSKRQSSRSLLRSVRFYANSGCIVTASLPLKPDGDGFESGIAKLNYHLDEVVSKGRRRPHTLAMDSKRFIAFHNLWRHKRPDRAYAVAAELVKRDFDASGLVWLCALRHYMLIHNAELFETTFRSMLVSLHPLLINTGQTLDIWQHAIEIGARDESFLRHILDFVRNHGRLDNAIKSRLYSIIMKALVSESSQIGSHTLLLKWNHRLLKDRIVPVKHDKVATLRSICAVPAALVILQGLYSQFVHHGIRMAFHNASVTELCRLKRFEDAQILHDFLVAQGERPQSTKSVDDLLQYHAKYSSKDRAQRFMDSLAAIGLPLSMTAKTTIAAFHGSHGGIDELCNFSHAHFKRGQDEDLDQFWASALQAAKTSKRDIAPIVHRMRQEQFGVGENCLQACIEAARSIDDVKELIRQMLKQNMGLTSRGYAVFIQFLARHGEIERAQGLLNAFLKDSKASVSHEEANFLKRGLILGLLEGKYYEELERIHFAMFLEQIATKDTWNLLLRARIQDNNLDAAISGLKEMELQGMDVENATAREFIVALLRRRGLGRNPDVMDKDDLRPYLVDIRMAISIVYKCMKLGGQTQPETWREVMKRIGLYGEFATLGRLTDWLIPQYSTDASLGANQKRYFRPSLTQQQLPVEHPQHPLSRLLTPRDIAATITRGFSQGKPVEALCLILRWQRMGIAVDLHAIERRLRVGLKYLARQPKTKLSEVKRLRERLIKTLLQFDRNDTCT